MNDSLKTKELLLRIRGSSAAFRDWMGAVNLRRRMADEPEIDLPHAWGGTGIMVWTEWPSTVTDALLFLESLGYRGPKLMAMFVTWFKYVCEVIREIMPDDHAFHYDASLLPRLEVTDSTAQVLRRAAQERGAAVQEAARKGDGSHLAASRIADYQQYCVLMAAANLVDMYRIMKETPLEPLTYVRRYIPGLGNYLSATVAAMTEISTKAAAWGLASDLVKAIPDPWKYLTEDEVYQDFSGLVPVDDLPQIVREAMSTIIESFLTMPSVSLTGKDKEISGEAAETFRRDPQFALSVLKRWKENTLDDTKTGFVNVSELCREELRNRTDPKTQ